MEICVFAETVQVDQISYEKLVERIFTEHFEIDKPTIRKLANIIIRGKPNLFTQLPYLLGRITRKYSGINCVFIFADADGEYPSITNSERRRVREKIHKFRDNFAGEVIVGVPTRNIEAWLLSDIGSINTNTDLAISINYKQSEEIKDPKTEFTKIYSAYRKITNDPLDYPELVNQLFSTIDINLVRKSSRSFEKLLIDLRTYLKRVGEI